MNCLKGKGRLLADGTGPVIKTTPLLFFVDDTYLVAL